MDDTSIQTAPLVGLLYQDSFLATGSSRPHDATGSNALWERKPRRAWSSEAQRAGELAMIGGIVTRERDWRVRQRHPRR